MSHEIKLPFYEFFAGGGLARLGLGASWECRFANDFDAMKGRTYKNNFNAASELLVEDVNLVESSNLAGSAVLSWASFPCQDLSLAGKGGGLHADRSGTFWPFWRIMNALDEEGRGVPIIALENVVGLLMSKGGQDFNALCKTLFEGGYRFGAVVMDSIRFLPQSRPRLFIVAVKNDMPVPEHVVMQEPDDRWHSARLRKAYDALDEEIKQSWIWWKMPLPEERIVQLKDIADFEASDAQWHAPEETQRLLDMMSPVNLAKVNKAKESGRIEVGSVYKRTRRENGVRVQRAEIRFDGVGGCLRTPAGGSSRQILFFVRGNEIKSRLISPREMARMMGLPDWYVLPNKYNECYHLLGDAVVVPVVSWLERHILRPLAEEAMKSEWSVTNGKETDLRLGDYSVRIA